MRKLAFVDAFAERRFQGNPAAVCFSERHPDADFMQALAAELNLSETAFVAPAETGFALRWFTPEREVELCGHATLAAAHAAWEQGWAPAGPIVFQTRSGALACTRRDGMVALDFPALPSEPCPAPEGFFAALGVAGADWVGRSAFDLLAELPDAAALRALRPDFRALAKLPARGIAVAAPSDDPRYDFVSRFFAPACGIDEDPVTGSAHCCWAVRWGQRLGKRELLGHQASRRGGVVRMEWRGERVTLLGHAVTVARGELA